MEKFSKGDRVRITERAYHRFPPNTEGEVQMSLGGDDREILLISVDAESIDDGINEGLGQFIFADAVEKC